MDSAHVDIPMKRQAGFSLIEVMFSFFVFAVGLLGLVALQVTALK